MKVKTKDKMLTKSWASGCPFPVSSSSSESSSPEESALPLSLSAQRIGNKKKQY